MVIVVLVAAYWLARFLKPRLCAWLAAWLVTWTRRDTSLTRLELATRAPLERDEPKVAPEPDPLCYRCVYSHIVRGSKTEEEMIECGYAFPARVLPFRVRECTDYRPKRERNRVDKVNQSAVCILPLDETAAEVHAVTAARNGEGEVESSYP
jgi:hypothetical protein